MLNKQPPKPPTIPDATHLYDTIMGDIEPELLSVNLARLGSVSPGDVIEEHRSRQERYRMALRRYATAYRQYIIKLNADVRRFQKEALLWAEDFSKSQQDSQRLRQLESAFK